MEFFQVFSLLIIVYVFMRFLPRKGRLGASIPIVMLISFTYQSAIMNDITHSFIQLYNSGTIFSAQMLICFSLALSVEISLHRILSISRFLENSESLHQTCSQIWKTHGIRRHTFPTCAINPIFLIHIFIPIPRHNLSK